LLNHQWRAINSIRYPHLNDDPDPGTIIAFPDET
jgi:hypothetical protein